MYSFFIYFCFLFVLFGSPKNVLKKQQTSSAEVSSDIIRTDWIWFVPILSFFCFLANIKMAWIESNMCTKTKNVFVPYR